ncbi:hypothetical protein EUX98_g4581 [Antrodiella citrinella]|uniref:F-box domain-containing protein n=1 Tax=Antrodiella citrinella TaxID=2447956 RepID=A0A4S4MW31_9APHY|nr:hypothetical protein EUX98_g4581 [Antrodiella citrinella]
MNHHSKSAPPYHLRNGFISLPEEVTEKIVVELARDQLQLGRGVAAFAQTCKQHRAMIYQPVDHSLWRRIYLTKYDDLRQISNRHRLYQATNFDWGLAFRERIRAYNYLRAVPMIEDTESEDAPRADSGYETNDDEQNLRSINALLSLIDTVLPVSVCMADFSPGGKTYREYWHSVSFETAHLRAVKPPASFDCEDAPSLNTVEYHESIAHGLPASLLSRLNSNTLDPEWDSTPLATALYKLIAQHALLSATRRSGWEPFALTSNMPSLIMHKRAYDLTRLKRGHLYGPFLSLTPDPEEDVDPADPFQFTPDWSHLVVIALIMRRILDSYDSWMEGYTLGADALRPGAWLRSELEDEGRNRDWAGVEGMWR